MMIVVFFSKGIWVKYILLNLEWSISINDWLVNDIVVCLINVFCLLGVVNLSLIFNLFILIKVLLK